ncbi:hypothetical protein ACP70R_020634 [Stipagrostis hirtigluma subsp. patula]
MEAACSPTALAVSSKNHRQHGDGAMANGGGGGHGHGNKGHCDDPSSLLQQLQNTIDAVSSEDGLLRPPSDTIDAFMLRSYFPTHVVHCETSSAPLSSPSRVEKLSQVAQEIA